MASREERIGLAHDARILVKATNWLGDVILSLPALRALRNAFPRAGITVLIRRELAAILGGCTWIERLLTYTLRRGPAGIADRTRIVRVIKEGRFDVCVLFPNSFDSALWPALAGV
ncbi:MAG: lipopolysaccharide heptosyltransferase II, partial [Planctomycetota bacterium]|nr:lipopolysaccharide heptosyltransferase II [Planctomycetota bacterium]